MANSSVNSQLFITSHSPTLTSKVPFENLILLDKIGHKIENCFLERDKEKIIIDTTKNNPVSQEIVLEKKKMLERYIDVTKSQMFFAKGCLFIEGISEELLITTFCKVQGFVLEDYRIELVNVDGTSFYPFLFLFNSTNEMKRLPQKIVILTDDDRFPDSKSSSYSFNNLIANDFILLNELRIKIINGTISTRISNLESSKNHQVTIGIKTAFKTLEYEICRANISSVKQENKDRFLFKYIESIDKDKTDNILSYLNSISADVLDEAEQDKVALLLWKSLPKKAEFAQDFSNHILKDLAKARESFFVPQYIIEGLNLLK